MVGFLLTNGILGMDAILTMALSFFQQEWFKEKL
jgi:hypothetical protein